MAIYTIENNYNPPDVNTSHTDGIERGKLVNFKMPAVDLDVLTAIALMNNASLGDELVKAIQEYILTWYEISD